ncbi:MAG: PKD domain-containing protein [Bacteroidales bacterium]|nr:PKD domain-containing protein [Bacteroidales bacterium]
MKSFIIGLFLVASFSFIYGQKNNIEKQKAYEQINTYNDVYFKFKVSSREELNVLPLFISVDNVIGNTVYAYVHKKHFDKLLALNLPFEVVSKTSESKALTMATTVAQMANWDRYPTYSVYVQMMQNYAANYSNLCKLDTIGTSQNGRLLLVLKITDNPSLAEGEPRVFFSGTMHGDEITGGVLLLRLADYLLTNYNTSPRVREIVDNEEIWINPFANPDGTYAGGDNTVANATRELANGVDPNRNFPNPVQGQHPDGESWAPETVAMMNFGAAHNFTMSMNTHGGAEVFNYPWDSWTSAEKTHADDNWWQYIGHEYADTVFVYSPSSYMRGVSSNGITEGADWYYAFGSRQDYFTYYLLGREVTLEISNTKLLDAAQLPNHWNYNYRSFLNYARQAKYGIHGVVTDACSGQPVKAKIFIVSHDRDSSHVYSSLPVGDYHRPIYAGTYSMTVSAPGYQSQTINNISVTNKTTVVRDILLTPLPPVADFVADVTSGCNATIHFTNQSQAPVGSSFLWDFGDGQTSTDENPVHTYTNSGTYTVTLTVQNSCTGNATKTRTNYITITLPSSPVVNNINLCGSGIANYSATASGTVYWYDAPQGGNQLATGNTYSTNISQTTTVYAENHTPAPSVYGGDNRYNSSGGFLSSSTAHYLIFDCYEPATLVSVQVNAQSQGSRTIQLQNASGSVLQSVTVSLPAGLSTVTLNFNLPVANGLRLVGPTNAALYRNNSGSSYPYHIGNIISITGNSANDLGYYYYFYNWEVKGSDCISPRVPVTANVFNLPIANAGQDIQIASGTSAQLNATATNGSGNYSYHWEPANLVNNANIANPTTVNLTQNQTFVLTVTDLVSGCVSHDTILITVSSNILTVNIIPSSTSVCQGENVILNTQVTGGNGNYTYTWESNPTGFSSSLSNPVVSPLTSTTYVVTVSDGFIQGTASVNINVLPLPQASFSYAVNQLDVNFTNSSLNANSYNWAYGDGMFSNAVNPIHTYASNGDYIVTLIATNDCGSDTISQTIHVEASGIENNDFARTNIYPNPVHNILTIDLVHPMQTKMTIYTIDGRFVMQDTFNSEKCYMNVEKLEQGAYIIEIQTLNGTYKKIFVKE